MNILIISYDFYPNIGGVAQHVYNLSKFLSKKHNVYVFTLRKDLNQKFFEKIDNVKIYRFLVFDISKIRGLMFLFQALLSGLLFTLFKKIDVIHSHTVVPDSLVGYFLRAKKRIFTNHSSQFLEIYDDKNKRLTKFMYKKIIEKYNFILAPSIELKEKSEIFFHRKSIYIPNGVDILKFVPVNSDKKQELKRTIFNKLSLEERNYLIFCPRRLEPKNGIEYFVKAIKIVSASKNNFWAIIAGNEYIKEYSEEIKKLIKNLELDDSLKFIGPILHEDIVSFYQASDIVVLPSLMEATSISGLEALSCGVPVIGTNVGGIPEIIVNNTNGFLVKPKNEFEIADRIIYLLDNEEIRLKMGKEARKIIEEKFSWDVILQKIENIYLGQNNEK